MPCESFHNNYVSMGISDPILLLERVKGHSWLDVGEVRSPNIQLRSVASRDSTIFKTTQNSCKKIEPYWSTCDLDVVLVWRDANIDKHK